MIEVSDGGRHPEMVDLRQAEAEKWRGTVKSVYMLIDPENEWNTRLFLDGDVIEIVIRVEKMWHTELMGLTLDQVKDLAAKRGLRLEKTKH